MNLYLPGSLAFIHFLIGITVAVNAQDDYPVPQKTRNMLFYFQRSHNKNTVIYELNTQADGKIDVSNPVSAYWIRYEEGGIKKDLSFLQKKAFGVQCQLVDKTNGSFVMHFNSFKKKEIYLLKTGLCYKAFINIGGEMAELTRLYIKSENNSLGMPLSIKYIDITGISIKTGKTVNERHIP